MYIRMKEDKFIGGSKLACFRLPIEGYKSTRMRVNELLNQIALEMSLEGQNDVSPTTKQSETTLVPKDDKQVIDRNVYPCGCKIVDGLFVRNGSCKMIRVIHGIE